MLFLNFLSVLASQEQCTLLTDGLVISKYSIKGCNACNKIAPIYEEIKNRAQKAQINLKFREIECTTCECNGLTSFPTIEITNNKQPKATTVGYKDYNALTKWISETLSLQRDVFANHIEHVQGEVKNLVASDFHTGFDGQTLILFYDNARDPRREVFKELAKAYKDKLIIAEVTANEAESVTARYNITDYPFILAINHGTPVPYTKKMDFATISEFAEKLYTPAFQEINYNELRDLTKNSRNGEPIFVVLYKNFEMASFYFNELAQQFKFKAPIYKSKDPEMFAASGLHPKDLNEFEGDVDHNQMVHLAVYKNSTFFPTKAKLDNTHDIIEWIFHTHFPYVTSINNDNFYTVFHGIKPVMLLLTENEEMVENFNKLSATWHLGAAASNLVFATIDTMEYPLFKKEVLKTVKEPAIAFYDPVSSQWYYKPTKLTEEEFNKTAMQLIDLYFNRKLPLYPPQKKKYSRYIICALVISAIAFIYKMNSMRKKVD